MEKYFLLLRWFSFVTILSLLIATKGYSKDLFETSLTSESSGSYSAEVEANISISDTGKVELSIEGLRSADDQLINQDSILVIETEINDSPKTYAEPFAITDGKAELEFTLDTLSKGDKLEIVNVIINTVTSPTPTPIITASPTPTSSPTATPATTPTPSLARTGSILAILVPGGIISESTIATPTPVITPSPAPTATPMTTPAIIQAVIEIKPETINLKSNGKFKAFIKLPLPYNVSDIDEDTVECEGAEAINGKVDKNRFIATFNTQDLDLDSQVNFYRNQKKDEKERQELTVTGELKNGTSFEGSDTVKIKGKEKNDDDDDDDDDGDDDDDDDDDHEKKRHH
ncbi:MAG: hypothetical protein DYG83_00400 [Candidatus Brocadia sp. AMX2]|uniref:Uncharacterized protein n=1 Tax=Candidatus Brocadia sinica JPN1 TaxID=1197129 RepID=A0ABQ0JW72_9BACT|nr:MULTISPECIES: hypothetical protein [Brocadia]MBL1167333.1 hypothetical protein [Candidatus Brocadia sp. AMX1]MCK6466795.1 hypothetical protein [Candidatus Brocadia sinica]MCQ3916028.1 hypothetical protein [Candidatus Brocadia sp.]NOG41193.1 hypothetical protein [Planctomycetota bacterium]KAA0245735.1 MAG: hypothetical protein EDM70_02340 [Candidatus Brocadia sp. AMX2]